MASREELIKRLSDIIGGGIVDGKKIKSVSEVRDGSFAVETGGGGSLRVKIVGKKSKTSSV